MQFSRMYILQVKTTSSDTPGKSTHISHYPTLEKGEKETHFQEYPGVETYISSQEGNIKRQSIKQDVLKKKVMDTLQETNISHSGEKENHLQN